MLARRRQDDDPPFTVVLDVIGDALGCGASEVSLHDAEREIDSGCQPSSRGDPVVLHEANAANPLHVAEFLLELFKAFVVRRRWVAGQKARLR